MFYRRQSGMNADVCTEPIHLGDIGAAARSKTW